MKNLITTLMNQYGKSLRTPSIPIEYFGGAIGPVALSIAIILFLYSAQLGGVSPLEGLINPLWTTCLGCAVVYALLARLTKNVDRAALMTMAATVAFFGMDFVMTCKQYYPKTHMAAVGFGLFSVCVCSALFVIFARIDLTKVRKSAVFVAAFFLIAQLQVIVIRTATFDCTVWPRTKWQILPPEILKSHPPKQRPPDIYYIIADTMPSQSVLENYYGLKNKTFDNFLKNEGFFVAEQSHSNYPITLLSIPSSLNMVYLNDIGPAMHAEDYAFDMSRNLIQNQRVGLILKHYGYKFINIGSGWGCTNFIGQADENVHSTFWDEFLVPAFCGTILGWPTDYSHVLDYIREVRLSGFKALAQSSAEPGPKFVFCHMLMPHVPCVFTADGKPANGGLQYNQARSETQLFLGQTLFCQKKLTDAVKQILAQPGPKPIIIIQGDHGPACSGNKEEPIRKWSKTFIRERFGILNAYYLPDHADIGLYQSITPVNSFRLIFNHYFGTNFDQLDDHSYAVTYSKPFLFKDISSIVKGLSTHSDIRAETLVQPGTENPLLRPDMD